MSTTFNVLPSKITVPTYKEIVDLANTNLNTYLCNIGIDKKVTINFNVQKNMINELLPFDSGDELVQNDNSYAWFFVHNTPGGTDCYYCRNLPIDKEVWDGELQDNVNAQRYQKEILRSMSIGYRWIFRRSAGQPAIIALSYGILAASLAQLTDGIIYSDDGAWDYSKFPADADEFLAWYFRPELATNEADKAFSIECIEQMKREL